MLPAVLGSLIALGGCGNYAPGGPPASQARPSPSRAGTAARREPGRATAPVTRPPAQTAVIGAGSVVLALGPGRVFAASGHNVFQISPHTLKVTLLTSVQGTAQALTYGAGSLWVATSRALYRVSPAHPRILATIGMPATGIAYGAGAVWAITDKFTGTTDRSTLTKVNTTTDRPSATLPMTEPTSVAAGAGGVWVGTESPPSSTASTRQPPGSWPG